MPSCDGSNCSACSSNSCSDETDYKRVKKELNRTKRKLSKTVTENEKLRKIIIDYQLRKH